MRRPRSNSPARPARIDALLGDTLKHLGLPAKIREYTIKKHWDESVGPNIAKRATPVRLIGTTLYCNVASSPWMTELNFHKSMIMEKLNLRLGEGSVTDIVLKIGPVSPKAIKAATPKRPERELTPKEEAFIEEVTAGIKDDGLKRLIKRVIKRGKS